MVYILYPLTTERAVAHIEAENKLTFVVNPAATKKQIRDDVKSLYNEEAARITTRVSPDGRKKAVVRFKRKNAASELASKLKIL